MMSSAKSGSDRRGREGVEVLLADLLEDLFAMDSDSAGGADSDADLFPAHFQNRDFDICADHDTLIGFACQYQHVRCPPWRVMRPL